MKLSDKITAGLALQGLIDPELAKAAPVSEEVLSKEVHAANKASGYEGRNFFEAWQKLSADKKADPRAIIHRGFWGKIGDGPSLQDLLQDSAPNSVQLALKRGWKVIEIDAQADAKGRLVFAHSAYAGRQTLINDYWKNVVYEELTPKQKEFVLRQFKDGRWTERYLPLGLHVMGEREFIEVWAGCQGDTTALIDTKGGGAIFGVMFLIRWPEFKHRMVIMIYNIGFPEGPEQFIDGVKELGGNVDKSFSLAITTNPNAFQQMAGGSLDPRAIRDAQIDWINKMIDHELLNIKSVIVVIGPDARYYNPDTPDKVIHPKFGTITDPQDIWRFLVLWVGSEIVKHMKECHPGVPIGAPSNRPVLIDGEPYVDHFETGAAVKIPVGTVNAHLFERGGIARNLRQVGADYVITEDPRDIAGTENPPYTITNYPARDYRATGLQNLPKNTWLVDENFREA